MKKIVSLLLFVLCLTFVPSVSAHPGNTAADGCHYCRTNCDKWGVPWNERHCHNGGTAKPIGGSSESTKPKEVVIPATNVPVYNTPIPTRKPVVPTKKPQPTRVPYKETDMDKKKLFKVVSIINGETLLVTVRGKNETVRVLPINKLKNVDAQKLAQCVGAEKTNKKLTKTIQGKFVRLIDDKKQGNRDNQQRLLRYVCLENSKISGGETK